MRTPSTHRYLPILAIAALASLTAACGATATTTAGESPPTSAAPPLGTSPSASSGPTSTTTSTAAPSPGDTEVEPGGAMAQATDGELDAASETQGPGATATSAGGTPRHLLTPCTPTAVPTPLAAGTYCRNVMVDGYPREFLVYVPAAVAAKPGDAVPVVVMLHGSTGTGEQFLKTSGWREKADAEGFLAVFPTGLQYFVTEDGKARWSTKWNATSLASDIDVSKRLPGYPAASPWPADDIGFMRLLLDDVATVAKVDSTRAYLSGFSNGSAFAARAAIELSSRFAAVGSVAGGLTPETTLTPDGPTPAPTWLSQGTADEHVLDMMPDHSELPLDPAALLAMPGIVTYLAHQTGPRHLPAAPCSTETTSVTTTFVFCAPGQPDLRFSFVKGLVHHYPVGADPKSNPAGVSAPDTYWKFFAAHHLA